MNAPPERTPAEMLDEDEARSRILAQIEPLAAEPAALLAAVGRFASREILATHALPGFDNSAMDGYAVALAGGSTLPAGTRLTVRGEQAAGLDRGLSVGAGEAIRIFTGAPVPVGTGAIVMQEDVQRVDGEILLTESVQPGEYIRRAGADVARGQRLVANGDKLTPQRIGLLASQGLASVEVGRAPRVAILATGDELRAPGQALEPGEIYESNGILLATLAQALGAEVMLLERARDERRELQEKLAQGLDGHDVLVVAGGVSVGERDFVKSALAGLGVELDLWRVRVQPGKPFLYGRRHAAAPGEKSASGSAHVFGLPGNPVSAFVTFLLFVRPAIFKLMGAADDALALPAFRAITTVDLVQRGTRPHYQRGILDALGRFTPAGRQESHALFGLSRSNALVRIEAGTTLKAGEAVTAYLWSL